MNVDLAAVDAAVKRVVAHRLLLKKTDDDKRDTSTDAIRTVERKAMTGFIAPLVERELSRRALADAKGLVRLMDAVEGGGEALARKCLQGSNTKLGRLVKGAFERLGRGAFGTVFAIDATRAVKVVRIEDGDAVDEKMADFATEVEMCRAAAKLGVAPEVFDAFPCFADVDGEVAGLIVMRRVVGETLFSWLAKKPSKAKCDALAAKLDDAIQKLHRASVFHHDLHGNNVMVANVGRTTTPFIVDFGLATRDPVHNWNRFNNYKNDRHRDFRVLDDVKEVHDEDHWRNSGDKRARAVFVEAVLDDLLQQGVLKTN